MTEMVHINDLFEVHSGDFHSTGELDPGPVPLVSCGDTNNGVMGYFEVPKGKRYQGCITVAYNGSWPLLAKYHPYEFGAKDDVAVLIPKRPLPETALLHTAAVLNTMVWRYSYGRKCFREKLRNVVLPMLSPEEIQQAWARSPQDFLPHRGSPASAPASAQNWGLLPISDLFEIERGDFHSLADLDPGPLMTVSRVTEDNGVVGYFTQPDGARVHAAGVLTVSTVGGDTFLQIDRFIATDNVLVLKPKTTLATTTLLFIAFALNRQKWRYSYGRQCYKTKFATTRVWLPLDGDGKMHEKLVRDLVLSTPYWPYVERWLPVTA